MNENLKSIYNSFANECVQYECSCKLKRPITLTYFCRYCLEIRCRNCVSNEVDSQYCQHCLEYIPTMDGKLKKNKCSSCFQCPCCMHTLSTRSFLEVIPSEEDPTKMTTKKTFTLVCCFCKWTSLDVGIPKQYSASGSWPEYMTPNAKSISALFEHYRIIAQKEKLEKDKKRNKRPLNAIDLFDKYGISVSLSPRVNESLRSKQYLSKLYQSGLIDSTKEIETKPAEASDYVEPLDEDFYYNREINITEMSSIEQRLNQIETQPELVSKFFPISKMLSVKRSLRCKVCEHNLIKSEYNPCLIRLKIQLSAYYHLPEIKIKDVSNLKFNQSCKIELTMKNPTSNNMKVQLSQNLNKDNTVNADIELPEYELVLLPKDETLEIGINQNDQQELGDDKNVISFRKANKIGFYVIVIPKVKDADCIVSFNLKHDFVTHINEKNGKELNVSTISNNLYLNLGKLVN